MVSKAIEIVTAVLRATYEKIEHYWNIVRDVANKELPQKDIDEKLFASYLQTNGLPDPDLLIRTSGENRLSNFLLWQMSYTEIYVTDVLWPDFNEKDFYKAIIDFMGRERRFGRILVTQDSKGSLN